MMNQFITLPPISSIVAESATSLMLPLPDYGPAIDDDLLEPLYHDHVVSRVSVSLPNRAGMLLNSPAPTSAHYTTTPVVCRESTQKLLTMVSKEF
jgi:hypothetical protein